MIARPIEQITKSDIETLLTEEVREGRTLEYKSILPGGKDNDKREFLADLSSFANAIGGDLVYGVRTEEGIPKEIVGLPNVNQDAEKLRLEGSIRSGIGPRVPAVALRFVDGFANGPVLVIRVPKSWTAPHMVTFQDLSRFYSRTSAGKYLLNVDEIRAAFAASDGLPDRIKRFRDDRLAKIVAGATPVPLQEAPKIVLHVVPFSAFTNVQQLHASEMQRHQNFVFPFDDNGGNMRINIDGLLCDSGVRGDSGKYAAYCQAFRNGIIETADANLIGYGGKNIIPIGPFEHSAIASIQRYLSFLQLTNIPVPILVLTAMLGVYGHMPIPPSRSRLRFRDPKPVDRDLLMLPEVLIEDYAAKLPEGLRPLFDGLWNAGGYERSFDYTEDGVWRPL